MPWASVSIESVYRRVRHIGVRGGGGYGRVGWRMGVSVYVGLGGGERGLGEVGVSALGWGGGGVRGEGGKGSAYRRIAVKRLSPLVACSLVSRVTSDAGELPSLEVVK